MVPVIRRILPSEGAELRQIRIRALTDAPESFASSLAETLAQSDEG